MSANSKKKECLAMLLAGGQGTRLGVLTNDVVFPNNSLFDTAKADKQKEVTKRNFYINGVDYTDLILQYGLASRSRTDNKFGFIELNQELFDALVAITRSERFEGISDSWQMLCYYEKVLGAPANS